MSDSLWPHGLWPTKLLCPWNFPNKNTGMVPFLTPRELPDQRIKPVSLTTPALAGGFFTTGTTWQTLSELWTEKIILVYEEMATHSSVLAWRIPGTGEPGGLLSMGSHKVGHDWSDLAAAATAACSNHCIFLLPFLIQCSHCCVHLVISVIVIFISRTIF